MCVCVCVSLQQTDRVDVKMVEEVCVGRSSVGTLVLHQVVLQSLLAGVAFLHQPQLAGAGPLGVQTVDEGSNTNGQRVFQNRQLGLSRGQGGEAAGVKELHQRARRDPGADPEQQGEGRVDQIQPSGLQADGAAAQRLLRVRRLGVLHRQRLRAMTRVTEQ